MLKYNGANMQARNETTQYRVYKRLKFEGKDHVKALFCNKEEMRKEGTKKEKEK
jgi:hypothetical protein